MARRNGGFIGTDGLDAPDPPTGVTVSGGADGVASISFTAPTDTGTSAITGFVATASNGIGATGSSSPISVSSLTLGTAVTFRAYAINAYGTSSASDATDSITPAAGRGLFLGGSGATDRITISYVTIATTGNATDFGDVSADSEQSTGCSSSSRGIMIRGDGKDSMEYVTIASTGNATDFGDTTIVSYWPAATGNQTRGVIKVGNYDVNNIDFITIATTGDATDFGDRTVVSRSSGACSSPTRGLFAGGDTSGGRLDVIDYITIASAGNATDFGNLTEAREELRGCSNSTRGIFFSGDGSSAAKTRIDYVTIASTGNATDFGDVGGAAWGFVNYGTFSSSTRAIKGGGNSTTAGARTDGIEYITIANTGNTADFGNLTQDTRDLGGCSNVHGGL